MKHTLTFLRIVLALLHRARAIRQAASRRARRDFAKGIKRYLKEASHG